MNWPEDFINKIICGDCLKVMKDIPDGSVDLILTDPPYNVGKDYGEYKDKLKPKDYLLWAKELVAEWKRMSGNRIVMVLGSKILLDWWKLIPDAKLIIVKMGAVSNNKIKNLNLQFHPILTTVKSNKWSYDLWEDIRWPGEGYFFNEPRYGHPAMTPLKLMKRCVMFFSKPLGPVVDPFLGVGTTAAACKEFGYHFVGIENNPKWCKIAEDRLRQEELF